MQFNVVSRETLLDAQAHPETLQASGGACGRLQRFVYNTVQDHLQDDIITQNRAGILRIQAERHATWKIT